MNRERSLTSVRQRSATARAVRVLRHLHSIGVSALVSGSLSEGHFGPDSDVDFLITAYPRHLKYRIEAGIEDIMLDILFDTVYHDEAHYLLAERLDAAAKNVHALIRDASF